MSQTPSPFAVALTAIFDNTAFYTRSEWESFLRVPAGTIDNWTSDKTVPLANCLNMTIDLLELRGGDAASEPLKEFARVASLPASEVSPHGAFMQPTVSEYRDTEAFGTLGQKLRGLSREQQHRALVERSWGPQSAME